MTEIPQLLERLSKVHGIGSMLDYRPSLEDLRALLKHIDELKAVSEQHTAFPLMLEALENLENDDRMSMPPSAWQLVQEAIKAAGGVPKPFTTPAADWRENGEKDPHGNRYDCERHQTIGGQYSDDQVANFQYMRSSDLESSTIAKDRIRWLSRKVVALEAKLEQIKTDLQDKHKVLSNLHMGDIAPGLTEEDVASLFPETIEKARGDERKKALEEALREIEAKAAEVDEMLLTTVHDEIREKCGPYNVALVSALHAIQALKGGE
ncbi:hypothetical protein ACQU0X_30810 [Pseudovibrio ascidiaceicola]|uniref:hypothetical protein n=1 Tax=Pseudovibrio ascidiaceicola TaxID=285279 RepID=UPI003D36313E